MHPLKVSLAMIVSILAATSVRAADVGSLAGCTAAVFREIGKNQSWSGKAPSACAATVAVTKSEDGVAVTAWSVETPKNGDWTRVSFTAVMDYAELAQKDKLSAGIGDIMARSKHLERCLNSMKKNNDSLDCMFRGSRDYLAGEETGIKNSFALWLNVTGRHTLIEYQTGSTSATPESPAELEDAQPLPPGLHLDLRLRGGAAPSGVTLQ